MVTGAKQIETIALTPAAAGAVKTLLEKRNLPGYALRVYISGGGCSGFQYGMALENNIRSVDLVCEFDGVKVVVDEVSIRYLQGAIIDFIDSAAGSGFKIHNPNAFPNCNCSSASAEGYGGCNCNG